MKTHCFVPAKLILSGEHAVLYQCPALSMAIDMHTHCDSMFHASSSPSITLELCNFNQAITLSFDAFRQHANLIEQRYQSFLQGKRTIQTVLTRPEELLICTIQQFEQRYQPLNVGHWHFKIHANVPMGRGLGSSAAVIVSLLASLFKQHQIKPLPEEILTLSQLIESRQHGQSSGIDPATLIYAGVLRYQPKQPIQKITPPPLNAWLIDSGAPLSSTGECVESVKLQHQHNDALWQQFRNTTQHIEDALTQNDITSLQQGIQQNHQLLIQIGVVPNTIQTFIKELQMQYNAAAKICGAGSIAGEQAGVILCFSELAPTKLCQTYGYTCQPITLQSQGLVCEFI